MDVIIYIVLEFYHSVKQFFWSSSVAIMRQILYNIVIFGGFLFMKKQFMPSSKSLLTFLLDAVLATASAYAALIARYAPNIDPDVLSDVNSSVPRILLCYLGVFLLFRVYTLKWPCQSSLAYLRIGMASLIAFALSAIWDLISVHQSGYTLTLHLLICWVIFLCFVWVSRLLFSVRVRNTAASARKVVIVGSGDIAVRLSSMLSKSPNPNEKFIGLINDADDMTHTTKNTPVIGTFDQLEALVHSQDISDIIIALPDSSSGSTESVISDCLKTGCAVKLYKN